MTEWTKEEDDAFARIERENATKGQPYHFDIFVSPSQRNQVLEEVSQWLENKVYEPYLAEQIRGMKK
jgi:hypothetical protein